MAVLDTAVVPFHNLLSESPVRDDQGCLTGSDIMTTYAKPALKDFPAAEEVTISLSKTKTLTVKIPDAAFEKYSNAQLTLGVGSTPPTRVGAFTPLTEGEDGTPLKGVTVTVTNAELKAYLGKLVELRYEVTYEGGDNIDKSESQKLRIKA
jgi:hypothetical protein